MHNTSAKCELTALPRYEFEPDGENETAYEDIVLLASNICDSPISFIGLVDEKRMWFKSRKGLEMSEVELENTICQHVLESRKSLIVEDLKKDPRFISNNFVKGAESIRFYLGIPIFCTQGNILGTLCVADYRPRKLTERQISSMTALARQVSESLKNQSHLKNIVETNKLSSLGMFSMYMAHEINNVLTIVEGYTSCAVTEVTKEKISEDAMSGLLVLIQNSTTRISKIVNGIKIYSRNSKMDPFERVSGKKILEDTLAMTKERCKIENIEIKMNCPSEDFHIEAHPSEIIQVLINLINNAVDAVVPMNKKWIRLEAHRKGSKVEFSVTDSGSGVPENIAKKLMQPFFTTKASGKGTGLGLCISKSIIESHSGKFFLDTERPTRFGFLLPLK